MHDRVIVRSSNLTRKDKMRNLLLLALIAATLSSVLVHAGRRPKKKGYSSTIYLEEDDPELWLAAEKGDLKMAKHAVNEHGDDINQRDNRGHTALHWASLRGHQHVVEWLLQQEGVEIDAVDKMGYTPLHYASHSGHYKIVRTLLNAGADQHKQTHHFHVESTAHHFADKMAHRSPHHEHTVRTLVGHAFNVLHLVEHHHTDEL